MGQWLFRLIVPIFNNSEHVYSYIFLAVQWIWTSPDIQNLYGLRTFIELLVAFEFLNVRSNDKGKRKTYDFLSYTYTSIYDVSLLFYIVTGNLWNRSSLWGFNRLLRLVHWLWNSIFLLKYLTILKVLSILKIIINKNPFHTKLIHARIIFFTIFPCMLLKESKLFQLETKKATN